MSVSSYDDLTPAQRDVVESASSTVLVFGGAGVGKTTTALWAGRREAERLRADGAASQSRVLFVTFSRTAVAQIQERAGGVLSGVGEIVEIMTFHGLAYRLVRAFGRYAGVSRQPELVGEARQKLLGHPGDDSLTYGDLLPIALKLVRSDSPIARLLRSRWAMVICDEFQDTDDLEWELLEALGSDSRLLLLADPNQMIYQFKTGVSEARLDLARARPECTELTLPPGSHRDPTQVLPDAAAEIRWRRFDSVPVRNAVAAGRLIVRAGVPEEDSARADAIAREVEGLSAVGHRIFGIYAKTNNDAAGLSVALTERGMSHVPIGFSEAYGEALAAMGYMAAYAAGEMSWQDVTTALAVTLTASVRSPNPPELATALHRGGHLSRAFEQRLEDLRSALGTTTDLLEVASTAAHSWSALGITAGRRSWERAGRSFVALAGRAVRDAASPVDRLLALAAEMRDSSFVELDAGDRGRVQLMNFSQTKGREADAVILSYTSNDWYGYATEPYDAASRLLYVCMTRARNRVVVMLPAEPHPLVAPFGRYA